MSYFETAYLKARSVMGESSPSVESMGRGMAEVRELSPLQRFAIAPTTRIVGVIACSRQLSTPSSFRSQPYPGWRLQARSWCNRLLYKRGCQGTFFSLHRRRVFFSATSSHAHRGRRSSGGMPLGLGLRCSISAGSSSWVATTAAISETRQALWLYGVNHGSI